MSESNQVLLPQVISLRDRTVVSREDSVVAMSLARTLTQAEHGSNIMAGVSWMKPGEVSTWWSTEEKRPEDETIHYLGPVHEFFYLMSGTCTIEWEDKRLDFVAEDTAFFAPGWRYRISNTGTEDAALVYAATPALG